MNWKKYFYLIFSIIVISIVTFFYINSDKIVYVGGVNLLDVDCSQVDVILEKAYKSDQLIRNTDVPFKEVAMQDHANKESIISIIEKCGMPTLNDVSQEHMNTVWLILQHSGNKYRKKYFPKIEAAVINGDLSKELFATMKDRILMDEGKPQLYGTQIKNRKLYTLAAPETVNDRRKEMGMNPIEQYLEQFNIKFNE